MQDDVGAGMYVAGVVQVLEELLSNRQWSPSGSGAASGRPPGVRYLPYMAVEAMGRDMRDVITVVTAVAALRPPLLAWRS
jgi:hypothetical protein